MVFELVCAAWRIEAAACCAPRAPAFNSTSCPTDESHDARSHPAPRASRSRSPDHVRRDRRRVGRRRRHGRQRAHGEGAEGPAPRGRQEGRPPDRAALDAVAVRSPAPRRRAAWLAGALAQRVHHPQAALRREEQRVQARLLVRRRLGRHGLRQEHPRRREAESVHGDELRVGPRARARREDEHLGPARAANVGLRLQGQVARRLRRGLADLVRRHRAVLRPRRPLPRHLGPQGRIAAPARQHFPADEQAQRGRDQAAQRAQADGATRHAVPRRRHDRWPEAQQVSQQVLRPRRLPAPSRRLRHPRRVRLADRIDLPGDGHRATSRCAPTPPRTRSSSIRRPDARAASRSSTA